jgi:hypothetical protein
MAAALRNAALGKCCQFQQLSTARKTSTQSLRKPSAFGRQQNVLQSPVCSNNEVRIRDSNDGECLSKGLSKRMHSRKRHAVVAKAVATSAPSKIDMKEVSWQGFILEFHGESQRHCHRQSGMQNSAEWKMM